MAFVVTGRKDTNEVHPRREIRDLQEHYPEQFALFIIGLTGVQYPKEPLPFMPADFKPGRLLPPGGDYFSIGGIHGIPYERWPGDPPTGMLADDKNAEEVAKVAGNPVQMTQVGGKTQTGASTTGLSQDGEGREVPKPGNTGARYGGYCNHGSVLFPPWHRPYLMVIEQSIGIIATAVAQEYAKLSPPHKGEAWIQAAKELRFPYWDWTIPAPEDDGFPDMLEKATILIRKPTDGKAMVYPNPIACYRFDEYMGSSRARDFVDFNAEIPFTLETTEVKAYFKRWNRTCRWPTDNPEANDRLDLINQHMSRLYADLRAKVAHIFTYEEDTNPDNWPYFWDEFSNTTVQSNPFDAPDVPGAVTAISKSLEAAHNSIHLIVGGVGHMGQNEFAAFDPVFYLHHANVDRIYALWEYVYPKYTLGAGYKKKGEDEITFFTQPNGTFTQLVQTRLDQWTDMVPWRKSADSYWTMDDVKSLEVHPPLEAHEHTGKHKHVYPKYYTYPPVDGVQVDKPATYAERIKMRTILQNHFKLGVKETQSKVCEHSSPLFQHDPDAAQIPEDRVHLEHYRHFVIVVELKEHAFGDSYSFDLTYRSKEDNSFSGHVAVLTRPLQTSCAGCVGRRIVGNTVKGMIHVPSDQVADMLTPRESDGTTYTEAQEANFCKKKFYAELIGRGGHVFAHTSDVAAPENERLDAVVAPKVWLAAAYACTGDGMDGDAPVELFGWKSFSQVFDVKRWRMGPNPNPSPRE